MTKTTLYLVLAAAGLSLSACSEKTKDAAETKADDIGKDAVEAGEAAGKAVEKGADDIGMAADKAAAKVEAYVQNEPTAKAKKD